jgi:hypothetical protein
MKMSPAVAKAAIDAISKSDGNAALDTLYQWLIEVAGGDPAEDPLDADDTSDDGGADDGASQGVGPKDSFASPGSGGTHGTLSLQQKRICSQLGLSEERFLEVQQKMFPSPAQLQGRRR